MNTNKLRIKGYATFHPLKHCWIGSGFKTEWFKDLPIYKNKKIIIAIDGHSSCGKSTMAKSIAQELGYIYIDSGAMYRVVTLFALRKGLIINGMPDTKKIVGELKNIKITCGLLGAPPILMAFLLMMILQPSIPLL